MNTIAQMQEITLRRTGKRPITFNGQEVVYATDRNLRSTRWIVVWIFRTDRFTYLIGIGRKTSWLGQRDELDVLQARTKAEVVKIVKECVPELADEIECQLKGTVGADFKSQATAISGKWRPKGVNKCAPNTELDPVQPKNMAGYARAASPRTSISPSSKVSCRPS